MYRDPIVTEWCLVADHQEVMTVLQDVENLNDWWSSAYCSARTLDEGDSRGVGRRICLVTPGPLLHTFRWQYTVTEVDLDRGYRFLATGDLVGDAEWRFSSDHDVVRCVLTWRIFPTATHLQAILPLYRMHHMRMMGVGEACLCSELKRRRRLASATSG